MIPGAYAAKIVVAFFQAFTHLITTEAANSDFFAGPGPCFGDDFTNCLGWIFYERLVQQDKLFVKLIHPAVDNLINDLIRLISVLWIVPGLGNRNLPLLVQGPSRNIFSRDIARFSCCDVHRNILDELLEFSTARDEIGFAIEFHQDADFAAHVNVRTDCTLRGDATLLFPRRGETTLA